MNKNYDKELNLEIELILKKLYYEYDKNGTTVYKKIIIKSEKQYID